MIESHLIIIQNKIQPDKFRCHETFKQRQKNTQLDNTGQNSNDEKQSTKPNKKQKKPAKCSIKAIRDLSCQRRPLIDKLFKVAGSADEHKSEFPN